MNPVSEQFPKSTTITESFSILENIHDLFKKKNHDYGDSWRALRVPSLTDQLLIKAMRLQTIYGKEQLVDDSIEDDFKALINYSLMACMKLKGFIPNNFSVKIEDDELFGFHTKVINQAIELMQKKNHDYGEVWREMRISSIIDVILAKLYRLRQMEMIHGQVQVSEPPINSYFDIINYSVFCLILLKK